MVLISRKVSQESWSYFDSSEEKYVLISFEFDFESVIVGVGVGVSDYLFKTFTGISCLSLLLF